MGYFKKGILSIVFLALIISLAGVTGVGQTSSLTEDQLIDYTVDDFRYIDIDGEYEEGTVLIKYQEPTVSPFLSLLKGFFYQPQPFADVSLESYRELNYDIVDSSLLELSLSDNESWYVASIEDGKTVTDVLIELARVEGVLFAQPNYIYKTSDFGEYEVVSEGELTNDPDLSEQPYLDMIGINEARDHLTSLGINPGGSSSVVVAVIDTGIDYTHPDLAANMWINTSEIANNGIDDDGNGYIDDIYGIDATTDYWDQQGDPMDLAGHGTHVAGIIAADGDNGVGIRGVADNVKLMALKAGESETLYTSNIVEAINYAVNKGADVINMSFASSSTDTALEDALGIAFGQAVLVAAAGNQGYVNSPHPMGINMYPAAYPWVIGVMADNGTSTAFFSNYDYIQNDAYEYNITAPGVDILSTLPNGEYAKWDGTSMSTPIVSAIAALLRSKFDDRSTYSSRFIMGQLVGTSDTTITPPSTSKWETYYQANAYDALTKLPQPELSFYNYYIIDDPTIAPENDGDGVIDAGETIQIAVTIRNQWGQSSNTIVTLDTINAMGLADPYVEIITDSVDYGNVGSFSSDDNGIIYSDEHKAVGIEHPFVFKIAADTPNDHNIRFNVTITANNGLDTTDTTEYVSDDQYFIVTTRAGSEVTTIISEDTTLTNDKLWIIENAVLVEEGVTLTIEAGTQVQFWSTDEEDFYATPKVAKIEVLGHLNILGTPDNPVEFFPSEAFPQFEVKIDKSGNGRIDIQYATFVNPRIRADIIDHVYFTEYTNYMRTYNYSNGEIYENWTNPSVEGTIITNSIFSRMYDLNVYGKVYGNLFDSVDLNFNFDNAENNVFLNNFAYTANELGDMTNINRSQANIYSWDSTSQVYMNTNKIFRNEILGVSYIIVNSNASISAIERYANYIGGHLAVINNEAEQQFINGNIENYKVVLGLKYDYFTQIYNWTDGTDASNIDVKRSYYDYQYYAEYASYYQGEYYTDSTSYYLIEVPGEVYVNDINFDSENILIGDETTNYQIQYSLVPYTASKDDLFWTSNNEAVVTVDQNGVVNPVGLGETTITVETDDGVISKTITIKVIETIPLTGMSIAQSLRQININEQERIILNFEPYNTTERAVTWASSNQAVATVDEFGTVKGLSEGIATITATSKDGLFIASTTVSIVVPVTSVRLVEDFANYSVLDSDVDLGATVYPVDATNQNLVWMSSDEDIAYVDEDGLLQFVSSGNVVIRVYVENTTIFDDIIISVAEADVEPSVVIDAAIGGDNENDTYVYVLMEDGSVWYFGRNNIVVPKKVTGLSDIIQIDAKSNSAYALKSDGTVWYMNGLSVSKVAGYSNITQISVSQEYMVAVKDDHTVWGHGGNYWGALGPLQTGWFNSPVQIGDLSNVVEVETTNKASIFRLDDGTIKMMYGGEMVVFGEVSDVISLDRSNTLYGSWYDTILFYTSSGFRAFQFNEDDYYERNEYKTLITDETIQEIGSNAEYSQFIVALTESGHVYSKWYNHQGMLGIGEDEIEYLDYYVQLELENIVNIEVGLHNAIAIDVDGNMYIWGANDAHQITDFTTIDRYEPFKVSFGLTFETNAPQIETISPRNNSIEVDVSGEIILNYDEALYRGYNFSYLTLKDGAGNIVPVSKVIELDRVVITPLSSLRYGTSYTLTLLSSSIQDMFGNYAPAMTIRFKTEEMIYINRSQVTVDINSTEGEEILFDVNDAYNGEIIWMSLDESIVTVIDGVLYPVGLGTTSVHVSTSDGSYTKTITVEVKNVIPITEINITQDSMKINTEEQAAIAYTVAPTTYNEDIIWTSSHNTIAVVDEYGNVYGVSPGIALITAQNTDGDIYDAINVQVIQPIESIDLSDEYLVVNTTDDPFTLNAKVNPTTATYKTVLWESSDETVATVSSDGIVTIHDAGTVVIRATGIYSTVYDQIIIFVSDDVSDTTTVVDVAAYDYSDESQVLVLLSDGTVWRTGNNSEIPVKLNINNVVDIDGNDYNGYMVTSNGEVWRVSRWDTNPYRLSNVNNIEKIASNQQTILALEQDGTITAWGENAFGQITDLSVSSVSEWSPIEMPGLSNIADIAVIDYTTIFLTEAGEIYYRGTGQSVSTLAKVSELSDIVRIEQGAEYSWNQPLLAYDINGNIYAVQFTTDTNNDVDEYVILDDYLSTAVPGLIQSATIRNSTEYYLNDLGEVYTVGSNQYGQLGIGSFEGTEDLTQVELPPISTLYIANYTVFAITTTGELYAWGRDNYNIIPDFSDDNVTTPTRLYFGIQPDDVAPTIIDSTIYEGQEINDLEPTITLQFNEYIEPVIAGDLRAIKIYDQANNEVAAVKTLGLNSIEIQLIEPLTYGEEYRLSIPYYTLKDRFDNVFEEYELHFTVADFIGINQSNYRLDTNELSRQILYTENPNYTGGLIWTSLDETIVQVDQSGLMTPGIEGSTEIYVESLDGTFRSVITVTVLTIIPIESINFSEASIDVPIHTSKTLIPELLPINTNEDLFWSSSNESVATVNEFGVVTGHSNGTTVITVENLDGTVAQTINVRIVTAVESIAFAEDFMALVLSVDPTTVSYTINPTTATNKTVEWFSSNDDIAYVDQSGNLHTLSTGTVVLRVQAVGTSIYDDIIITVTEDLVATQVVDVSAEQYYNSRTEIYALMSDGTLWYFGGNNTLLPRKVNITNVIQIESRNSNTLALKSDGTVYTINQTSASKVSGLTDIIEIALGGDHYLALKSDGTVWGWGYNYDGQLADKSTSYIYSPIQIDGAINVVEIEAVQIASIFRHEDGSIQYFSNGVINDFDEVDGIISMDTEHSAYYPYDDIMFFTEGLEHERYIFQNNTYGLHASFTTTLPNETVVGFSASDEGGYTEFLVTENGDLYARGRNDYGQLGLGHTNQTDTFTKVDIGNVASVYNFGFNTVAVTTSGELYIWGANAQKQITDFTTETRTTPFKVNFGLSSETIKPHVESTTPEYGDIEIDVEGNIVIDFDEAVYISSNYSYIQLTSNSGSIISINKTLNLDKLIIDPINSLKFGETYTITIQQNSVKDIFNNYNDEFELRFTTEELIYIERSNITLDINGSGEQIEPIINSKYSGELVWTSSDSTIVSVVDGYITPEAEGNATIYVSSQDGLYTKAIHIEVKTIIPITDINIKEDSMIISAKESIEIERTVSPSNYNENILWSSNDPSIATVNEYGYVYGFQEGLVTITAQNKAGDIVDTIYIIVIEPVEQVVIEEEYKVVNSSDGTVTIPAEVYPATATNKNLIWQSSDDSVATVNEDGVVTIVGVGNVVIRAQAEYTTVKDEITLFVSDEVSSTTKAIDVVLRGSDWNNMVYVLLDNGDVWYFGQGNYEMPQKLNIANVVDLDGHAYGTMAITTDGKLYRLDYTNVYEVTGFPSDREVVAFDSNGTFNLAILDDGTVYSWGQNGAGQIGDSSIASIPSPTNALGLTNIIDVAVSNSASVFVDTNGDVYYRGGPGFVNETTQITELSNIVSVVTNTSFYYDRNVFTLTDINGNIFPLTIVEDGYTVGDVYSSDLIEGNLVALSTTEYYKHTLYLNDLGQVFAQGQNGSGQLGIGMSDYNEQTVYQLDLENIVQVFALKYNSFAIDANGALYVWGWDNNRQVPDLQEGDRFSPYHVYFGMNRDLDTPYVESVTPSLNTPITVDTTFTIQFSEYVNASTYQLQLINIKDAYGDAVPTRKVLGINSIDIIPLSDLTYGETYTITIPEYAITDRFGNTLPYYETNFTTEDFVNLQQSYYKIDTAEASRQILFTENPNFSDELVFESQNESVVTVNPSTGLLVPVDEGIAEVYLSSADGTYQKVITIEVLTIIPIESILFATPQLDVAVNMQKQLIPIITPSNYNEDVSWASSNTSIATVNEFGVVTALDNGYTTITVTNQDEDIIGTIIIHVIVSVETFAFTDDFMPVQLNETLEPMSYTIGPDNATNQTVYWQSSDESIAYVDESGNLHKLTTGTVVIRGTATGTTVYDEIVVTVSENANLDAKVVDAILTRTYNYALMDDGTIWYWGGSTLLPRKTTAENIIQISGEGDYLYALSSNGLVYQLSGMTVSQKTGISEIVTISSTYYYTLAVKSDGTVWAWGSNGYRVFHDSFSGSTSTPIQVLGLTDIVDVAATRRFSYYLHEDGTMTFRGDTDPMTGFIDVPDTFNVKAISTDYNTYEYETIYITVEYEDGSIRKLSSSSYNTYFYDVDVVGESETLLFDYTNCTNTRVLVNELGELYMYGDNTFGVLGDGTTETRWSYEQVDLPSVTFARTDKINTLAITTDGDLYIWGRNDNHQIPNLMTEHALIPFKVVFGIEYNSETPYVEDTNLTALRINEPIELDLEVDFSKALKPSTNYIFVSLKDSQGGAIGVELELILDKLYVRPITDLRFNETYTLYIPDTAFVDVFNNYLPQQNITFTTEDFITLERNTYRVDINAGTKEIDYTLSSKFDGTLQFISLDETIATVDANGIVTPLDIGTVDIVIADSEGLYSKVVTFNIINLIPAIDINILDTLIILGKDESQTIEYTVTPLDSNEDLTWSVADPTVLSINQDGLIVGLSGDTTTVTLQNNDGTIYDTVTVQVVIPVEEVVIEDDFLMYSLDLVTYDNVTASVLPLDATIQDIVWQTANSSIAYVDEFGDLQLVGVGTVVLRATSPSTGLYDEVMISISATTLDEFNVIDVAGFDYDGWSYYALMEDGSLWTWGSALDGLTGLSHTIMTPTDTGVSDVVSIHSGNESFGYIKTDGTVWMLGRYATGQGEYAMNYFTQVPDLTNVTDISISYGGKFALKTDGTVWAWGNEGTSPVFKVDGLVNIVDMVTQDQRGYFLDNNGDVFYLDSFIAEPYQVTDLTNIKLLSETYSGGYMYAVDVNNKVYNFNEGSVVYEKTDFVFDPTLNILAISNHNDQNVNVLFDDGSTNISGYRDSRCMLGYEGGCSGYWLSPRDNISLQIEQPIAYIFAGTQGGAAIDVNGDVWVWGRNSENQLQDFSYIKNPVPQRVYFGIQSDHSIPQLISPAVSGSDPIPVNEDIVIDFDEAIYRSDQYNYIRLRDQNGNLLAFDKTLALDKLIIDPLIDLEYNQTYTIEIPNNALSDMFMNIYGGAVITLTTQDVTAPASEPEPTARDLWNATRVTSTFEEFIELGYHASITNNAILNNLYDLSMDTWLIFTVSGDWDYCPECRVYYTNNYWGTTDSELVENHVMDRDDISTLLDIVTTPFLLESNELMYPHVADVVISTQSEYDVIQVGPEPIEVTVTFNRDMDVEVPLEVYFGPAYPYTDFRIDGEWIDARTWIGTTNITPITGDGKQFLRIRNGRAMDDHWLELGDDEGRFMFEIITAGTESMNLQAVGSEGRVELTWSQSDFDLLAGFNVYRSTSLDGYYQKVNASVIPKTQLYYTDLNVDSAQTYYYKFTVVRTDFTESDFSNIAAGASFDTISPTMEHTQVIDANVDQEIYFNVYAQDNNEIAYVKLYYRHIGETNYQSISLVNSSGQLFTGKISAAEVTLPGIEYYVVASDGLTEVTKGTEVTPYTITVNDNPTIVTLFPASGVYAGGTEVLINGTNFKEGVAVYFSNQELLDVTYVDSNTIRIITPPHYPGKVDIKVENPSGAVNTRYSGFEYYSDDASIGVDTVKGGIGQQVVVPILADNLNGFIAGDFAFTYDSSVLEFVEIQKAGLTSRFSIVTNSNTPGTIIVSMANSTTINGSGELLYIVFNISDSSSLTYGDTTDVTISDISLNGSSILLNTYDGQIQIENVYTISGDITYYSNNSLISNVLLILDGALDYDAYSDEDGHFLIDQIETDNYTLTAQKDASDVNGISAFDATKVLQAAAGLISLNPYETIAADVNSDGVVNAMDASQILEYVAGLRTLPFEGTSGVWSFNPTVITYDNLSSSQDNQSLVAILIGDVTGNYENTSLSANLYSDGVVAIDSFDQTETHIIAHFNVDYYEFELFSIETTILFDNSVTVDYVEFDGALENCLVIVNNQTAGVLRIAVACANATDINGTAFSVYFNQSTILEDSFQVTIQGTQLNEVDNITQLMNVYNLTTDPDFNQDGFVNILDIQLLIDQYNQTYRSSDISRFDVNSDGIVDIYDIIKSQQND